ncbi:MAG: host-nuclease inhibitor Gam family protein [Hyphomicrobium sp.]|nr:host-nuclease inhibitor Gam family protein [Hyphomicrobium sp.]
MKPLIFRYRRTGTSAAQPAEPIKTEIARLTQGIQAYCETRRVDLTNGGRAKMFKFATGIVAWRKGRSRVEIDGNEADMIDRLKALGLAQFVRLKEEIDKSEILKSPQRIAGVPGLRVVEAPETIAVDPH